MTTPVNDRVTFLVGDAVQTVFLYDFPCTDEAELTVLVDFVDISSGVYTVDLVAKSITFDTAPGDTLDVVIAGDTVLAQLVQYSRATNSYQLSALESQLDRIVESIQELRREETRTVKMNYGQSGPVLANLVANSALIVNADGDAIDMGPTADQISSAQAYAVAAGAAQTAAEAALAEFLTRYLGSYASDALATAGAGGAPITGAIYWNSVSNLLRVFDGIDWVNQTSIINDGDVTASKLSAPLLALSQTKRTPKMFTALGDGTGDDTAAILAALADGPVVGDPGAVYNMTSQLVLPTATSFFDLNGATLQPSGLFSYFIRKDAPAFVSYNISSGPTLGSDQIVVSATPSGLSIGDEIFIAMNGPVIFAVIENIVGTTITLDRDMINQQGAGVVPTINKCAFHGDFTLANGTIDCSNVTGTSDGIIYVDHFKTLLFEDITFVGVDIAASSGGNIIVPYHASSALIRGCKFPSAQRKGQFVTAAYCDNLLMENNSGDGDGFGLAASYCMNPKSINNTLRGEFHKRGGSGFSNSIRGIKYDWCQGGTMQGNTLRDFDSGYRTNNTGGISISDNIAEYCGVSVNVSNQDPESLHSACSIVGNIIRWNQDVTGAIYVFDPTTTAHKVDANLIYQPEGDGIRGDSTYVGVTNNHIIEYGQADATLYYPIILNGATQSGSVDGNYVFSNSPSTALGIYVTATSTVKIGHNYGNLAADKMYHTLPAPAAQGDILLPGGIIEKRFDLTLTTGYVDYGIPTVFPHGFLSYEGAEEVGGGGSTSVAVSCVRTSCTASNVRLAAATAGTYQIVVRGY
jgi:hypothetical protein